MGRSSISVDVVVFEDYEIKESEGVKYIFPVGKPKKKTLYDDDIKKAFVKFIDITNDKGVHNKAIAADKKAIRFARKYGLLFNYRTGFEMYSPEISHHILDSSLHEGYRSFFSEGNYRRWEGILYLGSSNFFLGIAIKNPDGTILPLEEKFIAHPPEDEMAEPDEPIFISNICGKKGLPIKKCVDFYKEQFYKDKENGSLLGIVGECFDAYKAKTNKSQHILNSWFSHIEHFNERASLIKNINRKGKKYLNELQDEDQDEEKEELKKPHIQTFELTLSYTINSNKPEPGSLVNSMIKFKDLYDAFEWLTFTHGLVKVCPVCGSIFFPKSDKAVYCSDACKKKAQRYRKQAAKGAALT